jgi:hypothetical protein
MDQRYVSLSRTGYRVALLAGCVLLAPSAARAAPPHDVPGPVTVNSTSGNTVANWSASWTRPVSPPVPVRRSRAGWRRP